MRTVRLVLRHWHNSDRLPFAQLNADAQVMEFLPSILSEQESNSLVDRIEAHFQEHGFGLFAAEAGNARTKQFSSKMRYEERRNFPDSFRPWPAAPPGKTKTPIFPVSIVILGTRAKRATRYATKS